MIETIALTKQYGAVKAVDELSFHAADGAVTGLIGANGAGKTTTFRAICGVVEPDRGTARVDGHESWRERSRVLPLLGVLPDVRGLYPRLTAREHLEYFGALHGVAPPVLVQRIAVLASRLEMAEFIDRRARGLSRGQELKVALARALIHAPQNIILDEPTNGLDVAATRAVRELIRELRGQGRCVVLASHVMTEIMQLCDRLVIIDHGRVIATGTPAELLLRAGTSDLEEVFVKALATARNETRLPRCA